VFFGLAKKIVSDRMKFTLKSCFKEGVTIIKAEKEIDDICKRSAFKELNAYLRGRLSRKRK